MRKMAGMMQECWSLSVLRVVMIIMILEEAFLYIVDEFLHGQPSCSFRTKEDPTVGN